tara:strand:+ start:623 stop:952 length:330 start_codon:yes stop_codon:yes gene_type:complete
MERKEQSEKILLKYPLRVPVICEKANNTDIPELDRKKFLVPQEIQFRAFTAIIRKRLKLEPEIGMYFFVSNGGNEFMLPSFKPLMAIYDEYKDKDGFLYIYYSGESTFG